MICYFLGRCDLRRKTVCEKIPNHVREAVRKIDRKQFEHAK